MSVLADEVVVEQQHVHHHERSCSRGSGQAAKPQDESLANGRPGRRADSARSESCSQQA